MYIGQLFTPVIVCQIRKISRSQNIETREQDYRDGEGSVDDTIYSPPLVLESVISLHVCRHRFMKTQCLHTRLSSSLYEDVCILFTQRWKLYGSLCKNCTYIFSICTYDVTCNGDLLYLHAILKRTVQKFASDVHVKGVDFFL